MPPWTVDLDVLRHALRDDSLSQVGETLLQTRVTSPLQLSGITFTPTAALAVRVFNRIDDKDSDAVVGKGTNAPIPFASDRAWVKYTLQARAAAKVGFSAIDAQSAREVALSDYRLHDATESAWRALTSDLSSPRTLLDLDDVRALKPGEALALELGGSLTAQVSFSWSDILSTHLADILSELPAGMPIAVEVRSGLSATAGVRITDQFSVVVSRTSAGAFRFVVQKAVSHKHAYTIDVSLGATLDTTEALEEIVDPLTDQIRERLPDLPAELLRRRIAEKLEAAATWKAAVGVEYEYARIEENEAIADFVLVDETLLAGDYAQVMNGDFAGLAEGLREDGGARLLLRYLNESTLTRTASFGFSLGLGKWIEVEAEEKDTFRQSTRTSLDGLTLITCRGTRKYEERNIPQNDFTWVVDLKAQMKRFVERPSTLDFDYGLHFLASIERGAISAGDLERMMDFAAMWDVRMPVERRAPSPAPASAGHETTRFAELAKAIGRKGTLRVQLLFDEKALLATIGQTASLASWAEPLAMAMPFVNGFPERRTYSARRDAYAHAFATWLGGGMAFQLGVKSGLTILERQGSPGSFTWTVGEGHPHLRRRLTAFLTGVRQLHTSMTRPTAPDTLAGAYASLSQFWSQRLYVAAAGRWLLDRARDSGARVRKTLQIDLGETTITV
jgi:hypothetical protein